jgi:hypothetical protein
MQNRLISPTNNIDSCQGHPEKKEPSQTITGIRKACGQQRRRQLQGNGSHSWDNRLFYARCGSFPFVIRGMTRICQRFSYAPLYKTLVPSVSLVVGSMDM